MGRQVQLLPPSAKTAEQIAARKAGKTPEAIAAAKLFGRDYFDGPRACGYGGYRYDGRWLPVARDIAAHFGLEPGRRILDVGCAKGFLVHDLMTVVHGLEAFGLDVSRYAVVDACEPTMAGRLHLGPATELPFPDGAFAAAVSINTLHNLDRAGCIVALRELMRVSKGRCFVQVDAYRTDEERQRFEDWVLTAVTHGTPDEWLALFEEAGFTGDYDWTIV